MKNPKLRIAFGTLAILTIFHLQAQERNTEVTIKNSDFLINGTPTYEGVIWRTKAGKEIPTEGLLMNARLVQGIFDDLNPETRDMWSYKDTGKWDPERNTNEFVQAMESWRNHGLLAFTINLQGGNMIACIENGVSWGYFDFRQKDESLEHGFQNPPVDWGIHSER